MATVLGADLFTENARHYCAWIQGQAQNPASGTRTALRLLSGLYSEALNLPSGISASASLVSHPSQDDYAEMERRFEEFSLHTIYIHDPSQPTSEVSATPVHEIIALIYRHVQRGLDIYEDGEREEAFYYWQISFAQRWGYPLSALLHALHQYADRNQLFEQ